MTVREESIEEAAQTAFESIMGYRFKPKKADHLEKLVFYSAKTAIERERQSRPEVQLEYGWEWVSGINSGTFLIHGSDSKESAERAMADTGNRIAPVRIMVREKAVAGPWREA